MIKVAAGIILILGIALGITGALLKSAWDDVAEYKVKFDEQVDKTVAANNTITNLQISAAVNSAASKRLGEDRLSDQAKYMAEISELRSKLTSTLRAALEEPERFAEVFTYLIARDQRTACIASGGTVATCPITIPKPVGKSKARADIPTPDEDEEP